MEQPEKRGNTFAALGGGGNKKKTAPPTVAHVQQQKSNEYFFSRSRDIVEGAWADDSGDEDFVSPKTPLVDDDGFQVVPIKGKGRNVPAPVPVFEPVQNEPEEEEVEESSSEEESEDEEPAKPVSSSTTETVKEVAKPVQLSKKEKKKKEEEELNALLQELAVKEAVAKTEAKSDTANAIQEEDIAETDGVEGSGPAKKKKKKPAKKKEGSADATGVSTEAAKPAELPKKPVKKEAPKKSAVELAAIKEAKEREEKLKKKAKAKKLDFDPIH